ncbi:AmmeMemoRadiSam system protein A [Rhodobacter sp. Har01]|uniref:AmmeMemoRadiSam system protein A n=1 Tax=Rhodobacter sp. Har01 TaxID=2883999 RepID=UPI001D067DDF|nr:AmmeMemoRadiSam system protein A [Rhodobacter sp. Har01]MCB6178080.1 AmmeMemoRadiSam system protein A [Rhodobacter sp. Har01]
MDSLRRLHFAGSFFPSDPAALRTAVEQALTGGAGQTAGVSPRAIVSAHAGYAYSVRYAGLSFAAVTGVPARAVVLSPSHRHAFSGIAFPSQAGFDTPLGRLPIDRAACARLVSAGLAGELDAAHDNEHGIETQLPFIACRWPGLPVVPLVLGDVPTSLVAATIDRLDDGQTLFVLSSDLSHFLTDTAARLRDAETARMIERAETTGLDGAHACGARGIAGWLASKAGRASRPLRLGLGNSAKTSGDRLRVVGYGAWAFFGLDDPIFSASHRATLLRVARQAIDVRLTRDRSPGIAAESFAPPLHTQAASFVTLTLDGELRGCIGSLAAHQPLFADVIENAQKAAFSDPRFSFLTLQEWPKTRLKIAVLTRAAPLAFGSEAEALSLIVPGEDGLILSAAGRRGLFLPMVWEQIPEPDAFLRSLKRKAGLPADFWSADLQLHRFRAEGFAEA